MVTKIITYLQFQAKLFGPKSLERISQLRFAIGGNHDLQFVDVTRGKVRKHLLSFVVLMAISLKLRFLFILFVPVSRDVPKNFGFMQSIPISFTWSMNDFPQNMTRD